MEIIPASKSHFIRALSLPKSLEVMDLVNFLNKKKIESLKMGGLLAVNKGSIDEPTFTIMEWKPKNAKNKNWV